MLESVQEPSVEPQKVSPTIFHQNGTSFTVHKKENVVLHDYLPVGNYTIKITPSGSLYLECIDAFTLPTKRYGDNIKNSERIVNTFMSRQSGTGVLLTGEKGSGKSLLAKSISVDIAAKYNVPTIVINNPLAGETFNQFIQSIDQPCVILFDEFEKVYDKDEQQLLLTLLDGTYSSKKLFLLTSNNKWAVDQHMRNRPGRIFYMLEFEGLEASFVKEYCEDTLINKDAVAQVMNMSGVFTQFNFDMLKALVEEMNRYGESVADAMKMLNAKPEYSDAVEFKVQLYTITADGQRVACRMDDEHWKGNPLTQHVNTAFWMSKSSVSTTTIQTLSASDEDEEDEDSYKRMYFAPKSLKSINKETGKYTYQQDNYELILTLSRTTPMDFNRFAV